MEGDYGEDSNCNCAMRAGAGGGGARADHRRTVRGRQGSQKIKARQARLNAERRG